MIRCDIKCIIYLAITVCDYCVCVCARIFTVSGKTNDVHVISKLSKLCYINNNISLSLQSNKLILYLCIHAIPQAISHTLISSLSSYSFIHPDCGAPVPSFHHVFYPTHQLVLLAPSFHL
eukprot:371286_1